MTPTVLLDLQACQSPHSRQRGIGRYVWHLFESLWPLLRQRWRVSVLCSASHPLPNHGWLRELLARGEVALVPIEGLEAEADPSARWRNRQRYVASVGDHDALLIGSPFEEAAGIFVPDSRDGLEHVAVFAVLYDLIPYVFRERYLSDPLHARWYYARLQLLREADGLLAISEASRADAIRHLDIAEDRVCNIFGGVPPGFAPLRADEEEAAAKSRRDCGIDRPFLLYTGGDDWRKNINGLISAYARLAPELRRAHQLAIVCQLRPEALAAYRAHQRSCGLPDDAVVFPGYVSDDALRHLCATCVGLVFPSYYEGFGLPVAEAMACGRPAIVADASSLPELVPDPAARFDPADPADMAAVMERLVVDADWRERLTEQARATATTLTWSAVAARAAAAIERVPPPPRSARRKPSLAFVAPIPPQASGIADYSASLALQLARYYRITWVIGEPVEEIPPTLTNVFEIITASEFVGRAGEFSRRLYQFGNSEFHLFQLPLLARFPGIVALHEIGLDGVAWLAEERLPGGVAGLYGEPAAGALRAVLAVAGNSPPLRGRLLADALLWRIVASAGGLVVHSRHALDLLQRNVSQWPPRAAVVPLGASLTGPAPTEAEKRRLRARYGLPQDRHIVAAFGIVDPVKGIDLIAEALRLLPRDIRGRVFLLLAGPGDRNDWLLELERRLGAAGIGYRHTGRLAEPDFVAHLRLADLGISLRMRSRGESSAAVLRQVAHGLPTVATDLGSFAEIPESALAKVPPGDPEALAEKVQSLLASSALRQALGAAAIAWLRQRHWPAIAGLYREVIDSL